MPFKHVHTFRGQKLLKKLENLALKKSSWKKFVNYSEDVEMILNKDNEPWDIDESY